MRQLKQQQQSDAAQVGAASGDLRGGDGRDPSPFSEVQLQLLRRAQRAFRAHVARQAEDAQELAEQTRRDATAASTLAAAPLGAHGFESSTTLVHAGSVSGRDSSRTSASAPASPIEFPERSRSLTTAVEALPTTTAAALLRSSFAFPEV